MCRQRTVKEADAGRLMIWASAAAQIVRLEASM
jgi:hypothetical protein